MTQTTFSAQEPSLGYYYQIRYSLYLLLRAREKDNALITIEKLDDIVIEDIDTKDLYQTKLHIKSVANLTNASPDLWKTLRVWSEAILQGKVDINKTIFSLITTAKASPNSIPHQLKSDSSKIRDVDGIVRELLKIADTSTSDTNKEAYMAFKNLSIQQQKQLIDNIEVMDSSIDIDQAKEKIKQELRLATVDDKIEALFERLEGWWFGKCILHLQDKLPGIRFRELQEFINETSDKLKIDNLPIDFPDHLDLTDEDIKKEDNRMFVHQLKLISIGQRMLRNAVSDYYRTFEQRSKWLRDNLLNPNDELNYEKKLIDNWKVRFDALRDNVTDLLDDDIRKAGNEFYQNYCIINLPSIYIRDRVTDRFLVSGSYHMLSDSRRIGWHPNFDKLLK